jgi:hypothetical protein
LIQGRVEVVDKGELVDDELLEYRRDATGKGLVGDGSDVAERSVEQRQVGVQRTP